MWVGNGNNQPIEITTASFASSASFNSYTSSNDSKVNQLIATTGSYATTGSNIFTGKQTINNDVQATGYVSASYIQGPNGVFDILEAHNGVVSGSAQITAFGFISSSQTINTGSFATTGSNTFTGDQTLIDNAGNFFTITDASGSMMLVAKTFTSASAHISASASNQVNLIFKNNSNTPDTILSGSNNIFVNGAAPTAGFKRYIGGSYNIFNTT
jgi:hypothetical protein